MHDVAYGTVSDVALHFRDARPSHSDDPSKVSELIGLDIFSTA
jgi:hypothetical protein